jgi:hypothetical protein
VTFSASRDERDAVARLFYVRGAGERRAALLALLLTPSSAAELKAWREANAGVADAERIRTDIDQLSAAIRLPVYEVMLERSRDAPLAERQSLVEGARRLMGADGQVSPLDRLRWLVMRHRLGEAPHVPPLPGLAGGERALAPETAADFAVLTAFLARVLPEPAGDGGIGEAGAAWHARAMLPWAEALADSGGAAAWCEPPDGGRLVSAIRAVQGLSWMVRPVLLRAWVDALPVPGVASLNEDAADALRLAATLLDVPLPQALAGRYLEPGWN